MTRSSFRVIRGDTGRESLGEFEQNLRNVTTRSIPKYPCGFWLPRNNVKYFHAVHLVDESQRGWDN